MKIRLKDFPELKRIFKLVFPAYKGRTFAVEVQESPVDVASCWDGGTRSYFRLLRLSSGKMLTVSGANPMHPGTLSGKDTYTAKPGYVLVEHCYFCGKDMGLRAYFHPEDVAPQLVVS